MAPAEGRPEFALPPESLCVVWSPVTCQPQPSPLFSQPVYQQTRCSSKEHVLALFWAHKHGVSCFSSLPNPSPPNATPPENL